MINLPIRLDDSGWSTPAATCVVCGCRLDEGAGRIRMFGGAVEEGEAVSTVSRPQWVIHWYRGRRLAPDLSDDLRVVRVVDPEQADRSEAVIELCSIQCLRELFATIVTRLEQPSA